MALELTTDGNTQTSTTGNTGTSTTGDTVFDTFGKHTESVQGSLVGWYLAFTRIVTGISIDIQTAVSINLFFGYRFVIQDGSVATFGKLKETNVQNAVVHDFGALTEKIARRNQFIITGQNNITTLTETGTTRTTKYEIEDKNGDTSYEAWAKSKIITSANYFLKCDELASMSVGDENAVEVAPDGVTIYGKLIELE